MAMLSEKDLQGEELANKVEETILIHHIAQP